MPKTWPPIGELAWLRLDCCDSVHPTRVEDLVDESCLVGGPMPIHHAPTAPPRSTFTLGWSTPSGQFEQPVRLQRIAQTHAALWSLQKDGEGKQLQRRRYVRVETDLVADIITHTDRSSFRSQVFDISEGGMCSYTHGLIPATTPAVFTVSFVINNLRFELRARVARWGDVGELGQQAGIEFLEPPRATSDAIRAYVFARQLERRR